MAWKNSGRVDNADDGKVAGRVDGRQDVWQGGRDHLQKKQIIISKHPHCS